MKMKKYEKLAIVALVIYLISILIRELAPPLIGYFSSNEEFSYELILTLRIIVSVISFSINIVVAIWLYRVAKKERSIPWVWAMVGFIFGIMGGILYYVVRIYEKMKQPTY